ncbi:MarR family transcriptional regulator [Actinomycetospora sp. TBRC 11914]|nr:MarR family transcriptional regulator [Actinomycetospora sp. TBRC 11914]
MHTAMAHRLDLRMIDLQAIDHVVTAEESLGPVELARRLGIRSASASVLVDRLVDAGHLARVPDPDDGRRTRLVATDHARREARRALTPLLTELTALTSDLDAHDEAVVVDFLRRATAAMRRASAPG